MDDLISRQAVINAAIEAVDTWDGGSNKERERYICEALEKLPPALPEQKIGAWMPYDTIPQYVICRCSACGADILVPCIKDRTIFNYCPNCGAKMENRNDT